MSHSFKIGCFVLNNYKRGWRPENKGVTLKYLSCLFITLIASSTLAQTRIDSNSIEIIEINAQKRPQDIRDVTVSVSTIDGLAIVERKLKDTTALSAIAPNFKITQNAAEGTPPAVFIRGVGSVDYNTSTQSPIGVYIDGAAGASANSQLVNLFDLESVEVLRGPQGTLFGRNTTGGAILVNSMSAQFENSGYISIGYAQRNHRSLEGAFNRELNEQFAARLAFSHQDYEYSTNNLWPTAPQANMRQSHMRLSLLGEWERFKLDTKLYAGKWRGVTNPGGSIGVVKSINPNTGTPEMFCSAQEAGTSACTDAFGFNAGSEKFHDVKINNDINNNSPHISDTQGININAEYRLSKHSYLASISHYAELERQHYYNSDSSPARLGEGNQDVYTDTFSQEFRFHQQINKLYVIAGIYFLKEKIVQDTHFDLFRDLRSVEGLLSNSAMFFYDNTIDIQASAVFGHTEYAFTDKSSLTFGLRYDDEKTDYRAIGNVNVANFVGDQLGLTVPGWDITGAVEDNNLSGKLAFQHKFNPQHSGFVSYSRGYKSGGYNGALIVSQEEAINNDYGSETLNAYEVGLHSQLSSAIRLYSAAFYYDYQDQQVFMNQSAITPGAPPLQLISNVGESTVYGLEFELDAAVTSAFTTNISIGYIPEANLASFVDAAGNEIKDNRLPFTSKWNVAAQAEYVIDLGDSQISLQLDGDYQSAFYFDQNQSAYAKQDSYVLLNANLAWEMKYWTASLWVKNITDQEYSHLKFDLINLYGMLQDFKGEARQIGLGLNWKF